MTGRDRRNNGGRNDDRTRDCSLTGRNRGVQGWHTFVCFFRGLSASTLDLLGRVVCGVPGKENQLVQTGYCGCFQCLLDVLHCGDDVDIDMSDCGTV